MVHGQGFHPFQENRMIPPKGFKSEVYPLRHRIEFSAALTPQTEAGNTCFIPIIMSSSDMDVDADLINVNPHNTFYQEDTGPLVRVMSIVDKLRISLKFNALETWNDLAHTSGLAGAEAFSGDGLHSLNFLWRPIFGSFGEKLDAADDDTGATVASLLGLTKDDTNEDVVPITTAKLNSAGASDKDLAISTVNAVQVLGDYNMTSNMAVEEHVFDEDLFQSALRRFTNKGALRSMVGRTRHVTISRNRPFKNYYIDKFLPRAIRRIVPFSFFGIQVHVPFISDVSQYYHGSSLTDAKHLGIKCLINFHEWNSEHNQDMLGDAA